jgi:LysW-gamma-L-lysine carboxypeptidase
VTLDSDRLLREMVSIYSPAGEEAEIGAYLVAAMRGAGFSAGRDEAGNAVGELGAGSRHVVLLGHMDTVPGFIPVREEEGRLYGRGAVDAKGPLATFIAAAALAGPPADGRLTIIGAVEEEGTSRGARHIVDRYRPDFTIIGEPSGWERITLGYKGSLWLRYALVLPKFHGAGQGQTAPELAVAFWNRLVAAAESFNAGKTKQFEMLSPTLAGITSSSDGFTVQVEMDLSVRWPLEFDDATFLAEMRAWAAPAEITLRSREVPFRAEKRTRLTAAFLGAIRSAGGEPGFTLKTGTADMNIVGPAWGCPIVAYGPGDSSLDHTPEEHIEWGEYHKAIDVLAQVLKTL